MAGRNIETALILAAGNGTRLGDLGRSIPKALLPVINRPLLVRHLEVLAAQGVRDVHVVIGHLGQMIKDAVAAHPIDGLTVHFHVQEERLGLGHAVLQAEAALSETPFVLILADIAFSLINPDQLFQLPNDVAGRIAVKEEQEVAPIRLNFSVIHDGAGRISKVIEKPQDPPNMLKGTGQYSFDPTIFEAIRKTPRSALRNEYELTDAIQTLIDMGRPVEVAQSIDWDLNLTFPADVLACNLHFRPNASDSECVATQLPTGSRVTNCIIGPDVTADGPVDLLNCVILEGAHLASDTSLRDMIVAPFGSWRRNQ
ncbi:MAG: sugar phosphate nucleotidyltransferase [Paracoccaceae bacterium]